MTRNFLLPDELGVCDAARNAVRKTGCAQKSIAESIGLSESVFSGKLNGHAPFTAGEVIRLSAALGTGAIIEHMADDAALDVVVENSLDALRSANLNAEQEFHEATHGLNVALADNRLTREEYETQSRELEEAIEAGRKEKLALDAAWRAQKAPQTYRFQKLQEAQ